MKSYSWIVLTNCTPGDEDAFESWYDDIHIPDLLRVPGIVSAKRSRITPEQTIMVGEQVQFTRSIAPAFRFLAIYTFHTDDPEAVLQEVVRRSGTSDMMLSPTLADAHTLLFQDN